MAYTLEEAKRAATLRTEVENLKTKVAEAEQRTMEERRQSMIYWWERKTHSVSRNLDDFRLHPERCEHLSAKEKAAIHKKVVDMEYEAAGTSLALRLFNCPGKWCCLKAIRSMGDEEWRAVCGDPARSICVCGTEQRCLEAIAAEDPEQTYLWLGWKPESSE